MGFDVADLLPSGWRPEIRRVALDKAVVKEFPRTPFLTREAAGVGGVVRGRGYAEVVRDELPWLYELYRSTFVELAEVFARGPVSPAADDRYGVVLNLQQGRNMRFECHVDSNPVTGLLFCTDHAPEAGGEIVFADGADVAGVEQIEEACSVIRPTSGHLVFFDGREHAHYVRPLVREDDVRIAAVMNFYTESCPETTRPRGLNAHIFGQEARPTVS